MSRNFPTSPGAVRRRITSDNYKVPTAFERTPVSTVTVSRPAQPRTAPARRLGMRRRSSSRDCSRLAEWAGTRSRPAFARAAAQVAPVGPAFAHARPACGSLQASAVDRPRQPLSRCGSGALASRGAEGATDGGRRGPAGDRRGHPRRARAAARRRQARRLHPAARAGRPAALRHRRRRPSTATTHAAGDADEPFSIQSISKVFLLTLALGKHGESLWTRVGREPSGDPFNSIVQLEHEQGRPRNPFINAGAIVVTDLVLAGHTPREAIGEILRFLRFLADDDDDRDRPGGGAVGAGDRRAQLRAGAVHAVLRPADPSGRRGARGLFPPLRRGDELPAAGAGRAVPGGRRPRPDHRRLGGAAGAGAADQRADADLRALRRLGRLRLPRRAAGEERRRRRHPGGGAGPRLDLRLVAGARRRPATRCSGSSRSRSSCSGPGGRCSGRRGGDGAVEKTRTSTGVSPQRPQRCASTSSATTALAGLLTKARRRCEAPKCAARSGARQGAFGSAKLGGRRPGR